MDVALVGADGVILDVISADSVERAQDYYPASICVQRPQGVTASAGDRYADGAWTLMPRDEAPRFVITKLEFLSRFTQNQRMSIMSKRAIDPIVADAMYMLDLADMVDITHADTIAFVTYMASAGFIGADDAGRILA